MDARGMLPENTRWCLCYTWSYSDTNVPALLLMQLPAPSLSSQNACSDDWTAEYCLESVMCMPCHLAYGSRSDDGLLQMLVEHDLLLKNVCTC